MSWILAFMIGMVFITIASGIYLSLYPQHIGDNRPQQFKKALSLNALGLGGGLVALLLFSLTALAAPEAANLPAREFTTGLGLAFIGIGIPTGLATIGAGMAVGTIGAAALAVVAEKPEAFGRSLIFIGLAEGIAIYGLVVSILLLDKL